MTTKSEVKTVNAECDPRFKHFDGLMCAVFNCNGSDQDKGREAVLAKFGKKGWDKVLKLKRTGIMEIFQHPPTQETQLYADTVGLSAEARFAKATQGDKSNEQ